jgi:hypothetical protein
MSILPFMSTLKILSLLCVKFSMVFLKDLFSDLFSSSHTPLLSILSYVIHLQIIISMRITGILNVSYHPLLLTLHTTSVISNTQYLKSLNPSKTEFLLVGLPRQLSKLSNPIIHLLNNVTLSPVHSAPNVRRSHL